MRPWLALTLLSLAPAPTAQEPAPPGALLALDAEPPARFALRCGGEAVEFADGESFTLPDGWGGRTCALQRLPTRRFAYPGAVALEYPDGAQWLAATDVPEFCWWDVLAGGEMIALQRHVGTGDAAHHRELYAANGVKCGWTDLGACTITLDGRAISGRRLGGDAGGPFAQEVYAFAHAGATWLLLIQHAEPAPGAPALHLGADGAITIAAPPALARPTPLRDRLIASFRFL